MRISEETRFPHPVLSEITGDYLEGTFLVDFLVTEDASSGDLRIEYAETLTEPDIRELVLKGLANISCIVRCEDTFYSELLPLSWPAGRLDFKPGTLVNRVTLQPVIALNDDLARWSPESIHDEFETPLNLKRGDILAVALEQILSIGQAKFAKLESIFDLRSSEELPRGRLQVVLDADRIELLVPPALYEAIMLLRGKNKGLPVVMTGVYLPALIEVLDILASSTTAYDNRRWYRAFMARCDSTGVQISEGASVLESAQMLFEDPLQGLTVLAEVTE